MDNNSIHVTILLQIRYWYSNILLILSYNNKYDIETILKLQVYGPNFTTVPLSAHKVFESCRNVLLTQRFFFITDVSQRVIYVISDRLSETRKSDNGKFNPECIVGHFSLVNSKEVIRAVYRAIDCTNSAPTTLSEEIKHKYTLPKGVRDIKIELPHVDTCIIVTNHSVYKIVLRSVLYPYYILLVSSKFTIIISFSFAGNQYYQFLWN